MMISFNAKVSVLKWHDVPRDGFGYPLRPQTATKRRVLSLTVMATAARLCHQHGDYKDLAAPPDSRVTG